MCKSQGRDQGCEMLEPSPAGWFQPFFSPTPEKANCRVPEPPGSHPPHPHPHPSLPEVPARGQAFSSDSPLQLVTPALMPPFL